MITKLKKISLLIFTLFGCCLTMFSEVNLPKYINPTGNEFPIIAWSTFRFKDNINFKNFKTLRECGFNISLALVADMDLTIESLKLGEETGIKIMANCPEIRNLELIPANVEKIRDYKSLMGYYLADEPLTKDFEKLKKLRDAIYKYDPKHFPFVNLHPIVSPDFLGSKSYRDYIEDFIKTVQLPLVSYDNYPVLKQNGKIIIRDTFYENLEIVSEVTRKYGIPFWAFCMCTPHFDYPYPTKADLQFEAFSALAYGAQGISYYNYTIETDQPITYASAPLNLKWGKTKIWGICQANNRQIQNLSHVFLGADLISVGHTGQIPNGTKRLTTLPAPFKSIKTDDPGVLVSHLKNKGRDYLVIVSHSVDKSQKIELTRNGNINRVFPDGKEKPDNKTKYKLEPGGFLIFSW